MLPLVLSASIAFASPAPPEAPQFTSQQPEVAALATRLWRAGVECTGWAPKTKRTVPITVTPNVPVGHGEAILELSRGPTREKAPVLTEIRILPTTTTGVLAHELAHAWAGFGTVALVEGKAEVLGRCMMAGIGQGRSDAHRRLQPIPDLRAGEWRVDPWAYLAAARLVRVLDQVMPPEVLWQQKGPLSWEMVDASLVKAGATGQPVLAALHGGKRTLRRALRDANGDGRLVLEDEVAEQGRWSLVERGPCGPGLVTARACLDSVTTRQPRGRTVHAPR